MPHTNIVKTLHRIRAQKPLIHNITNFVVMNFTANGLLAIGASPLMAHAIEEINEIIQIAQALVINIGTLDKPLLNSMKIAMQAAQEKNIPIVIDPVGVGATSFRTQAILNLINQIKPTVIRGNAAEILALAGASLVQKKGVDSEYQTKDAFTAGLKLAERYACIIVISGQEDLIISQQKKYKVQNGHAVMKNVTGMGCLSTAIIAAFCAINTDFITAAVEAVVCMGLAGEMAAEKSFAPGSFAVNFLDELSVLSEKNNAEKIKIMEL